MFNRLFLLLCIVHLIFPAGCGSAGTPSTAATPASTVAIDQTSPALAMHTFWNAIDEGDARAARQVCIAGKAQSAWIDAFAGMCRGWRKLNAAREKKFGEDATVHQTPAYTSLVLSDKMVVQEQNGQTALVMPDHPELATFVVKKDGKWFLDMNRSMQGDLPATTKVYQSITAAANEVATNTDAGKYTTDEAADAAFKTAIAQKLNLPQKPATQPGKP